MTNALITIALFLMAGACGGGCCWWIDVRARKQQADWRAESNARAQR